MGINLSLQSPLYKVQQKFSAGKGLEGVSRALYAATVREKKELVGTLVKSKMKEVSPLRVGIWGCLWLDFCEERGGAQS
jgi:hypothetical protein